MTEKVVIGNAELWHGDCREILPTLPQCDLILTDPPYGIGIAANPVRQAHEKMEWDAETPAAWLWGLMMEKAKHLIVWGGQLLPAAAKPDISDLGQDAAREFQPRNVRAGVVQL